MYAPHKEYENKTEALKQIIKEEFVFKHQIDNVTDVPDLLIEETRPFTIIRWSSFNPQSHTQVVKLLNNVGWRPFEKTKAHSKASFDFYKEKITASELAEVAKLGWKINDSNLATLPSSAPREYKKLALYLMVSSRESQMRKQYFQITKNERIE